jgi:hypothetical protein
MDDQRTDRTSGRLLTVKLIASWLVVVAFATTLIAFWHFLVFHSLDTNPPIFWVLSAVVALSLAFIYMLISALEALSSQKWRFSLRAVLTAMTIVAIVLGTVIYATNKLVPTH